MFSSTSLHDHTGVVFSEEAIGGLSVLGVRDIPAGHVVLDRGLQHTAICISRVGRIDPHTPQISYRGHDVRALAAESSFAAVARLLFAGEADIEADRGFEDLLIASTLSLLPAARGLKSAMEGAPLTSLASAVVHVAAITGEHPSREEICARAIAAIAAATVAFHDPVGVHAAVLGTRGHDNFVALILASCFGPEPDPVAHKALNEFLILHAEHGMNCSTLAVRAVASAGGEAYDSVVAGIAAFKGPLHGGASRVVGEILDDLERSGEDVAGFVQRKLEARERIHGFGHRIYRIEDPRASFMRETLESERDHLNRFENIALSLAQTAVGAERFRERGIAVNPDMFNGLLLRRAGFASAENTALLCLSRSAGWLAHHFDSVEAGEPLLRPQELSA